VQVRSVSIPATRVPFGEALRFSVGVKSDELTPDDMVVEMLLGPAMRELVAHREKAAYQFKYSGKRGEGGEYIFELDLAPELCGKLEYRVRAYPFHKALSHRFEMGLMKWV
jgi:starch phosphorylase